MWLVAFALLAAVSVPDGKVTVMRPGPIGRGDDAQAAALLGKPPPAFPALAWVDGKSRSLASFAGHVVVIRSFTHTCPYCASTMPALERIARDYRKRGVEVVGVYHPKPPRAVAADEVRDIVRAFGVTFPVAIDPDWSLVNRWWLDGGRDWTSVTWVLDQKGVVRFVHPGGEYHRGGGAAHEACRTDEAALRRTLDQLLGAARKGAS